jgi:hypothetical protein
MDAQPHVSSWAIQQASKGITDDIKAKIRSRVNVKPITEPTSTAGDQRSDRSLPFSGETNEGKAINAEVKHTRDNASAPAFPTASITAAVRAADVLLPQALEQRVLLIAGMYLNGDTHHTIADKLQLDAALVKREIAKIDSARAVTYKNNPELAEKVTRAEYDVVQKTIHTVSQIDELADMLVEEMRWDYQDGMNFRMHGPAIGAMTEVDEEADENNTKKKPKRRPSISPMKVDALSKLLDVRGKQLDRLTNIFGLVQKHVPEDTQANVTNFIQINGEQGKRLNDFADMFLKQTGNAIAPPPAAEATITVEAEVSE